MKIGKIDFLNVLPFYHALGDGFGPLLTGSPTFLAEAARQGKIDAAPLPLVETFYLEEEFEPLSDFGIACRGSVGSVMLFSQRPFDKLSGARLLFTADSSTSVALARYLLDQAGNTHYQVERGDRPEGYDGYLSIGDRALIEATETTYLYATDLSKVWYELTGLPFVFARWVVRKSVTVAERNRLADALSRSLAIAPAIPLPNQAGLPEAEVRAYLRRIIFRLDADCLAGAEQFRKVLHVFA